MKNITVSVPDEVYRQARIRAAERGKSVSSLVSEYLSLLTEHEARFERLQAQQERITDEIGRFAARDRLDRNLIHDRAVR